MRGGESVVGTKLHRSPSVYEAMAYAAAAAAGRGASPDGRSAPWGSDAPSTGERVKILTDDALSGLRSLPGDVAQTCATSPPFYLLRRYGTSTSWPDGW